MKITKRLTVGTIGVGAAAMMVLAVPASADPGTVKVGDGGVSGHANDPHVGCQFQLLQFGMDGTPTFELVAPTEGVFTSVTQVGDDEWALAADPSVAPDPQQGLHVRVTVNGNKTKVFWIDPCIGSPQG